ncbi:hypothetical protein HGB25_02845, partial [Candidatus Saccharibacteria bacterium]|nr:hypothetical protein [Candidatus Saccharibacteria bacterium]
THQPTPTAPLAPPTNLNDSSTGLVDTNGILTEDAQLAKSMQPDGNTDSQLSNLQ